MNSVFDLLLDGRFLAAFAAALASLLAGIGSAIGVGICGEASAGLVTEEPNRFGKALLLQALPGTQGIYGLLAAFVIMTRTGILAGAPPTTVEGLMYIAGALPVGIVGLLSAIAQGRVAAGGVGIITKRPEEMAKGILMAVMVEFYAILALLVSMLMLVSLGS